MPAATIVLQVTNMAFLKKKHACDNCGKDLDDVDDPIEDGNHEFCSTDCKEKYADDHDHEDDEEERDVCEFC